MIRLSKSVVGQKEADALSRVIMEDGMLGMGSFTKEFEERLCDYLGGGTNVICVNTGTSALHLALEAIGIKGGDEVLVQSLTYLASFQAISAAGAVPVACEVIPENCTIDLYDAEKRVTKRTKAIMPVHYAGRVGDLDAVYAFASRHNIRVIEDAAHAFGTAYKGNRIGSFGDVVCFSFDGIKNITSGEGGAVVTADEQVTRIVRDARLLGVQKDTEKRYAGKRSWEFDVTHQGYRYHMSNLFAAIGIVQLERLEDEFLPERRRLARRYIQALSGHNDLLLFADDYDDVAPFIYPVRILNDRRDGLRNYLIDNGIECGVHYYPNHLLTYYGALMGELPATEKLYGELLTIPLRPDLTNDEQDYIINKINEYLTDKGR